jgi:poly-gamma-glutamate synthesis protein (capsule biosynthesis protein)
MFEKRQFGDLARHWGIGAEVGPRFVSAAILIAATLALPSVLAYGQTPYQAARGNITFALTGDSIISRPLSAYVEPEFLAMVEAIRGADLAFTNLEIALQTVDKLTPMVSDRESYMFAHPSIAGELAWAGFDAVSRANNHALDYGWDGMRATSRALDDAGVAYAGVGENLALADEAGYVQTGNGRVALISTASSFDTFHPARPQRPDIRATPGLNPIRYHRTTTLAAAEFEALKKIAQGLGRNVEDAAERFDFAGETFARGDETGVSTKADPVDLQRILASVDAAKRQSDWVIVATHTHESAASRELPADFLVEYARAAIDAGADVFVGTGPHILRGIEIYKGRPIFYSLGNFFFENETVRYRPSAEYRGVDLPADSRTVDYYDDRQRTQGGYFTLDAWFWETVVAMPRFEAGALEEIRLLPVTLGYDTPRARRGRPMLAGSELGRKIIDDLARLSAPYGTEIRFEDGVGVVRTTSDAP